MPVTVCAASGTSPVERRVMASAIFWGSCASSWATICRTTSRSGRRLEGEVQAVLVEHELERAEPLPLGQGRQPSCEQRDVALLAAEHADRRGARQRRAGRGRRRA